MVTKETILEAWRFLRTENQSIPDDTIDLMKNASLNELSGLVFSRNDLLAAVNEIEKKIAGMTDDNVISAYEDCQKIIFNLLKPNENVR